MVKIGGFYAANSFASSSPEPFQLYLCEHWVINDDGGFERPRVDTLGVLILTTEILTVEFLLPSKNKLLNKGYCNV